MSNVKMVTLTFPNGNKIRVAEGTRFKEVLSLLDVDAQMIVGVKENNKLHTLGYQVLEDCNCELVSYNDEEGREVYARSIKLLFIMAVKNLYPSAQFSIDNKINGNYYVTFSDATKEKIQLIKQEMGRIVENNQVIGKRRVSFRRLKKIYEESGYQNELDNYRIETQESYSLYESDGKYYPYLYGKVVHETGILSHFDLQLFAGGMILVLPKENEIQRLNEISSIERIQLEFAKIAKLYHALGVCHVSDLNRLAFDREKTRNMILTTEDEQHNRLCRLVSDIIVKQAKIILIAGPSASGKTTFSKRLQINLQAEGIVVHVISMDNYFKNADDSPVGEDGQKNFESIGHFDLEFFERQMNQLLDGEHINVPTYDFKKEGGMRTFHGETMQLGKTDVIILEGIHALNPAISNFIQADLLYKIYIAPLVTLGFDDFTKVSSNVVRLARRILRDQQTRGVSLETTLERWEKVRKGEVINISPYIEDADCIFNTFHLYELNAMRPFIETLLLQVSRESKYYNKVREIYRLMQNFVGITSEDIPSNSVCKEFIGNGCFKI